MRFTTARRPGHILRAVLSLLLFASAARADGTIGFLTTTPRSELTAGQAFSWMEVGRDLPSTGTVTTDTAGTDRYPVTVPNTNIRITTWRTTGSNAALKLSFSVPDNRVSWPAGTPGGTQLRYGDRIVIQLDPNDSGHAATPSTTLSPGASGNQATDYRFELALNIDFDDAPDATIFDAELTGYRLPLSATEWGDLNAGYALPGSTSPWVTATYAALAYNVEVTIPLDFVGLSAPAAGQRVGLAFAIINDLAYEITRGGTAVAAALAGTVFPSSMGMLSYLNDPGIRQRALVARDQATGNWLVPSTWGTGYFDALPGGEVSFSQSPSPAFSSSLRIGKCNTATWDAVEPVVSRSTVQSTLRGWYKYYRDEPCDMRVWFKVEKRGVTGGEAVRKRFLVLWSRPDTSPQTWAVVALSPVVSIVQREEVFNVLWENVYRDVFLGHPCLRVYALPWDLRTPSGTTYLESDITGITSWPQLNALETAFGLAPGADARTAQMNFDAFFPGSCPSTDPEDGSRWFCHPGAARRDGDDERTGGVRILKAGLFEAGGNGAGDLAAPARLSHGGAQTSGGQHEQTVRGYVRVFIEAFGVEPPVQDKPYAYISTLGGVGHLVPAETLAAAQDGITLNFGVTNPPLLSRDYSRRPPLELRSPVRDVYLGVRIDTSAGVPAPTFTRRVVKTRLAPGETTDGSITLKAAGGWVPPGGKFRRWGLSLHAGASIPHDNLGRLFGPGPSFAVDAEYRFNRFFSLEGVYGFHRFRGETLPSGVTIGDVSLHQLSLNGRLYGGTSPLRPFFNAGPGAYKFDPGDVRFGVNVGGGLQLDVTPGFAVEGGYNFHHAFSPGGVKFSTAQGGVRFRF